MTQAIISFFLFFTTVFNAANRFASSVDNLSQVAEQATANYRDEQAIKAKQRRKELEQALKAVPPSQPKAKAKSKALGTVDL